MEDIGSLWNYHEVMDELKHMIMHTNLEIEQLKMEASEETRKNNECVNQLIQILKITRNERDEARNQLQNLLNNKNRTTIKPRNVNSSITQSNRYSDNFNPCSSPVDVVSSSPEFFNLEKAKNLPENGKFLQAVLDAGPLLQTLMVAGPLPTWRNPPHPMRPFHVPLVSDDMSCGSNTTQTLSNFGSFASEPCFGSQRMISAGDCYGYMGKRQRLH